MICEKCGDPATSRIMVDYVYHNFCNRHKCEFAKEVGENFAKEMKRRTEGQFNGRQNLIWDDLLSFGTEEIIKEDIIEEVKRKNKGPVTLFDYSEWL